MSFPRYPSYKDSGVEWLGEVPGHWVAKKIGAISSLKGRLGWQGLKADEYRDEGPFVVSSAHFDNREIQWGACPRVSQARYDADSNIQLAVNDVLLMKDGAAMGKLAYVSFLPGPACLNSHLLLFRPVKSGETDAYNPRFVFYFMQTGYFQEHIKINGTGATFLGISQDAIARYQLVLPPYDEQSQIALFLDRETAKIDALVAEQRRLMELLKEKRQAVISHAVTKGLNPNAPMKPSGIEWLGDVPEHWEVTAIKRFTDTITDGAHISPDTENGVFHFVSTKDVYDDSIDFENSLLTSNTSFDYMVKSGCRPRVGDVLFSKDGTIGRTVVVKDGREFVVASSLIIIRPKKTALDPDFLNCLCQSRAVASQVESFVKGAGLPRLSIQNLVKVFGCFPPLDEQIVIASFLKKELAEFGALATEAQRAIDLLQERRTALISAAVTGQIDVRHLSGEITECGK